jgi:hypothetical protein
MPRYAPGVLSSALLALTVTAACGRADPAAVRSAERTAPLSSAGGEGSVSSDIEAGLPPLGAFDAALTRLFTPAGLPEGTYRVYVSTTPIETLLAALRMRAPAPAAGSWRVTPMEPLKAFGSTGPYDPFRLTRTYGSLRPQVARGPIERNGTIVAALTLISPYPDITLSRLVSGTLVIVLRMPASAP